MESNICMMIKRDTNYYHNPARIIHLTKIKRRVKNLTLPFHQTKICCQHPHFLPPTVLLTDLYPVLDSGKIQYLSKKNHYSQLLEGISGPLKIKRFLKKQLLKNKFDR